MHLTDADIFLVAFTVTFRERRHHIVSQRNIERCHRALHHLGGLEGDRAVDNSSWALREDETPDRVRSLVGRKCHVGTVRHHRLWAHWSEENNWCEVEVMKLFISVYLILVQFDSVLKVIIDTVIRGGNWMRFWFVVMKLIVMKLLYLLRWKFVFDSFNRYFILFSEVAMILIVMKLVSFIRC